MNHSQRSTCFKVIIQGDFLAKNMIIQHWSMFFIPPQNPPIYGSVRFKTIGTLLDWTPFSPFSFSHQSCWKITSRKTIPDLKRYLFAMKFIFKHIFGHFLKMNEKVKLPFSRPKEKNTFLFCENLNVLYFYISNIMPPLMLVLLASPPPDSICCYFFPVVVNFYVKPIGPLLSPLFLQKSNPRDFHDR